MKKRVANTILGLRVTFTSPAGVPTTGYFIQPRDYRLLYNILNGYKNLYEKVVLELAGLPLVLPNGLGMIFQHKFGQQANLSCLLSNIGRS